MRMERQAREVAIFMRPAHRTDDSAFAGARRGFRVTRIVDRLANPSDFYACVLERLFQPLSENTGVGAVAMYADRVGANLDRACATVHFSTCSNVYRLRDGDIDVVNHGVGLAAR